MDDLISRQAALDILDDFQSNIELGIDDYAEKRKALCDLPSAEPKTDDENELKFYYVESIDDYWIGQRLDNFYYADWHECLGFVWSKSRYLPWGEHIVDENTLWKEHTYPSEPIEIPFTEWIVGFMKKYSAEPKTGKWIIQDNPKTGWYRVECSECDEDVTSNIPMIGFFPHCKPLWDFCPHCGADMRGEEE